MSEQRGEGPFCQIRRGAFSIRASEIKIGNATVVKAWDLGSDGMSIKKDSDTKAVFQGG